MVGSTFVSAEEAARQLGVNRRSVFRYIKQGYLRSGKDGKSKGVYLEDVEQLRRMKDEPLPIPLNKISMGQLMGRVTVLESRMKTVLRLLNIQYAALSLTDPEIRNLFLMAQHQLVHGWGPHMEEQWADTFIRMNSEDLTQLERITHDKAPWKPFYLLCLALRNDCENTDLKDQFGAGANHLHALASIHSQLKGETPIKDLSRWAREEGSVNRVVKMRSKTRKRTPPKRFG